MKLKNISKVKEINTNNKNATKNVNELLKNGWIIIDTYKTDHGHPTKNIETLHYVLGLRDNN